MQLKRLLFLVFLVVCNLQTFAQSIVVEGQVTDEATQERLPGVNIFVKGTTTGTTTNLDGKYKLEIPSRESVLVFSFIGMVEQEIVVGNQSIINISMGADAKQLEEVMVIAYGETTKESFTGSASVVDSKAIEKRPLASATQALQGTVSGLKITNSSGQPGSTPSVNIRGVGSISAGTQPLYVVDGVILNGGLADINPNDIASTTVLKDASAAALYGSRAANGVIIITTKRGTKGQTKINFDAATGVSQVATSGYELMNAEQYYKYTWDGLYNRAWLLDGMTTAQAGQYANDNVAARSGWNPYSVSNPYDIEGNLVNDAQLIRDIDWRDAVLQTGITQSYNLSLSKGTETGSILVSAGYFNETGVVIGTDYERFTFRFNGIEKMNSWLEIGVNTSFTYSVGNGVPDGGSAANPMRSAHLFNPATPIYDGDDYNWNNQVSFDFNPVGLVDKNIYRSDKRRAIANAYAEITLPLNIKFRTTNGVNYTDTDDFTYYNPEHGDGAAVNGRGFATASWVYTLNTTNLFSWNKDLGEGNLDVMAGQEANVWESYTQDMMATEYAFDGYYDLSGAAIPGSTTTSLAGGSMMSFFSRVNYEYKGRYNLSASVRTDGSSNFAANNKWGTFGSMGVGWRLSEEAFLEDVSWVNFLKLRASYGISGNQNFGAYTSLGTYGLGANYGGNAGMVPVRLENPDLSWEKNKSLDVGLDFTLFNIVTGTIGYYERVSDDLLYSVPKSPTTGFRERYENAGEMKNSGLEIELKTTNIKTNDFMWETSFNFTQNVNELTALADGQEQVISGTKIMKPGNDLYQYYLVEWAGVNPDTGQPMWFTNTDNIDEGSSYEDPLGSGRQVTSDYNKAERVESGSALPKFYGGITNTFAYKNFDLSFLFYYSYGNKVYNSDYAQNMHDGSAPGQNLSTDALDAWTPDNRYTDVPRNIANSTDNADQMSTRFLEDGSYLRLQNVTLGYTLPQSIAEKMNMQRFRVYMIGENLLTFTEYKGYDPELGMNGNTNQSIPGVAKFTLGVNVEF